MKKLLFSTLVLGMATSLWASSEMPSCEFTKKYLAKDLKLHVQCNEKYLIFCKDTATNRKKGCEAPKKRAKSRIPKTLKVAGFNVYNLGMEQDFRGSKLTALKDHSLLADVISKFDLVGAIELKHQAKEDVKYNLELSKKEDKEGAEYRIPPYLEVLTHLINKQKSSGWTLVLSPDLFGNNPEDTLNNELTGYFYKRSKIDLVETEYCETYACAVPASEFKAEVARKPFLASFKAADKDFTMASVHFRYRHPTIRVNKKPVLNEEMYNEMLKVYDFEKHTGHKFNRNVKAQLQALYETSSRFSEVKSVANFLGKIREESEEKDILLFGDFNLMAPAKNAAAPRNARKAKLAKAFKKAWYDNKGVLENFEGAKPYINDQTTVGKEKLLNPYDHFVMSKTGDLSGCKAERGKAYNFTDKKVFKSGDSYIRDLDLELFVDSLREEKKIKKGKIVPRHSEKKLEFLARGFQQKVLDSYDNGTFTVYKELISDHLPIYMNCSLTK